MPRHDEFYPDGPATQGAFGRIINHTHFRRLKGLLDRTAGRIVIGGATSEDDKFIAPTIVGGVKGDDSLMSECVHVGATLLLSVLTRLGREIFGPILPIVPVKDVDEAIAFINERYVHLLTCILQF